MARNIRIAAAQMGATHYADSREHTLDRMLALLIQAADQRAEVVLFPELAFTTFFPRHLINDPDELSSFFEVENSTESSPTKRLFDKAQDLGLDVSVGFAEQTSKGERFNTSIYFHSKTSSMLAKYRKIHLPGEYEPFPDPNATQQLEKRYFKPGDLGFNAFRVPNLAEDSEPIFGMMICNDRRWSEAWRCLGLQGVEVVLCGYNTAGFAPHLRGGDQSQDPQAAEETAVFQHKLSMQANSYQNATFYVCAARCGMDDGKYSLIGGSCIVDPEGNILGEAKTKEDEVVVAECDLEMCRRGKTRTFNFAKHRRVEHYGRIVEQIGVVEPPKLNISNNEINGSITNGSPHEHESPDLPPASTTRRSIRILLVNPNATPTMTASCYAMALPSLPPDVQLSTFTAPSPAPTAIESAYDNITSSTFSMRALQPLQAREAYDAILIACYSDHALIKMAREEFHVPVCGIMEASLYAARMLGGRFGIVATGNRSKLGLEDSVRHYGFQSFCVGVEACEIGVLDLERKPRAEMLARAQNVAKSLVSKGAEVVTLGCAGMSDMKIAVEEAVGEDVVVIDGVMAGVQFLSGLVRMGAKTAKNGLYADSAVGRKMRGQEYL